MMERLVLPLQCKDEFRWRCVSYCLAVLSMVFLVPADVVYDFRIVLLL